MMHWCSDTLEPVGQVVKWLMDGYVDAPVRFVSVFGATGIGKSSVAAAAAWYMHRRGAFPGTCLPLQNTVSVFLCALRVTVGVVTMYDGLVSHWAK